MICFLFKVPTSYDLSYNTEEELAIKFLHVYTKNMDFCICLCYCKKGCKPVMQFEEIKEEVMR